MSSRSALSLTHGVSISKNITNSSGAILNLSTSMRSPSMKLDCDVQSYAWGKLGTDSEVARLKKAGDSRFDLDINSNYAELWMGTHPSCPSRLRYHTNHIDNNDEHNNDVNDSTHFAYHSTPSTSNITTSSSTTILLSDYLKNHPEAVGLVPPDYENNDLPFLFKILSIKTALSIQAHPDKALAQQLHDKFPSIYKDANHKPEMAVALTKFQAMCGFRSINQIKKNLSYFYEIKEFLSESVRMQLESVNDDCDAEMQREVIRRLFRDIMHTDDEFVKSHITGKIIPRLLELQSQQLQLQQQQQQQQAPQHQHLERKRHDSCSTDTETHTAETSPSSLSQNQNSKKRIKILLEKNIGMDNIHNDTPPTVDNNNNNNKDDDDDGTSSLISLMLQLHADYPGDIGCIMPALLNTLTLNPSECFFMGSNEPHAYISGDCVEIMALSDNVVRAGLTPKFKDVDTLCSMLHYRSGIPSLVSPSIIHEATVALSSISHPHLQHQQQHHQEQQEKQKEKQQSYSLLTQLYRPSPQICAEFELERVHIDSNHLQLFSSSSSLLLLSSSSSSLKHFRALPTASILLFIKVKPSADYRNSDNNTNHSNDTDNNNNKTSIQLIMSDDKNKPKNDEGHYNSNNHSNNSFMVHEGLILLLPADISAHLYTNSNNTLTTTTTTTTTLANHEHKVDVGASSSSSSTTTDAVAASEGTHDEFDIIVYRAHINLG